MTSQTFEELYKKLNTGQKKAVDTIDGPVMVIAGPGTGKTSILTLRIANILKKTDTTPDSILALTFTESGVHSMRKKLVDIIGVAGYRVHIHTFHSFCNEVIKNYAQEFPRIIGAQHVTDVEQIKIMEELILKAPLERLRPAMNTFFYLKPILGQIRELKREDIDPETFEKDIKKQEKEFKAIPDLIYDSGKYAGEMKGKYKDQEKKILNNKELALLYKAYQERLAQDRLYDYEDMIMEVIRVLKANNDLLLRLQETYQYVLADEHQDANTGQNRLLELISGFHEVPNLFIVGDEKQAIFRFQGASLENFLYFKKRFPDAELISLEYNYRSPQTILDGSHSLIQKNKVTDKALRVELKSAQKGKSSKIKLAEFSKPDFEYLFLVKDIQEKIAAGVDPESIAVLYRDNRDAFLPKAYFDKAGILSTIHSDTDLFSDEDINKLISILYAIDEIGNTERLAKVLFIDFLKHSHLDVYKLLVHSSKERKNVFDVLKSPEALAVAKVDDVNSLSTFYKKLTDWSRLAKNKGLIEVVEHIVRDSGFLSHCIALPNSFEKLAYYDTLLTHIKSTVERHRNARLHDFIQFLDTLSEHDINVKSKSLGFVPGRVNLMTAHKSKGLEFEHVYILGATDGHWSNKRHSSFFDMSSVDEEHALDDDRRLFYVALTRAKKEVSVLWSKENEGGKHTLPTQFVTEIDETHTEKIEVSDFEVEYVKKIHTQEVATTPGIDVKDRAYLSDLFLNSGFSVTALNNYLRCPWQYFFINLVRVPKAEEKQQLYGTAVHETLKDFFDAYRVEEDMDGKVLLERFENYLMKKHLTTEDYEDLLKKGKKALGGYYEAYKKQWNRAIVNELSVGGVHLDIEHEGKPVPLKLTGKLDKVEIQPGVGDKVNVVDYKTGKPKTRNELEGKTKNSDGDYWRQLVFYKVLLNRFDNGKYTMVSGEIDFIEPDEKGRYKKELFEVGGEQAKELEQKIAETAKEILLFSFWDRRCDDKDCDFCALRNVM